MLSIFSGFRFRWRVGLVASLLPLSLLVIVAFLLQAAWPAITFNGIGFLTHNSWNLGNMYADPVTIRGQEVLPRADYGVLFLVVGTLLSSLIALALAVPVGVLSAIFLAEGLRGAARGLGSFLVELLAAVPSVVYGLWGYLVLIPLLGHDLYPWMAHTLGPVLPMFRGPSGSGYGLLTAGILLAFMVVPLITASLRDALAATPAALREAGASMGASRMEVVRLILLRGQRNVVIGVTVLAFGRALGETMAVLMVSGNALNSLPKNIYDPVSTMAAFIASQLDSALQDPTGMAVHALAEIALLLMLISVLVNAAARGLLWLSGYRP
ncbi:phosphate ABC transporter permease subunit PstC [Halothiobacillus diazotrophicus]|uniref:Phosphate transport system permease protein n=1 Tax=Halothiobacillus diazotrophicus TaxID=1860122 RepID=A0A191ZKH4_9GAMM|nr:phosphate ABC transporter permease subunit PstC [Halothiobacillus diazotrophicus]ANJ68348.1 phosphate ABC transporter permease subunit PstC [Halothiobacillus diazotrophicus]